MKHESEPSKADDSARTGAKWFVIFFLLVVPTLGFTLVLAIAWTAWKNFFAR